MHSSIPCLVRLDCQMWLLPHVCQLDSICTQPLICEMQFSSCVAFATRMPAGCHMYTATHLRDAIFLFMTSCLWLLPHVCQLDSMCTQPQIFSYSIQRQVWLLPHVCQLDAICTQPLICEMQFSCS